MKAIRTRSALGYGRETLMTVLLGAAGVSLNRNEVVKLEVKLRILQQHQRHQNGGCLEAVRVR